MTNGKVTAEKIDSSALVSTIPSASTSVKAHTSKAFDSDSAILSFYGIGIGIVFGIGIGISRSPDRPGKVTGGVQEHNKEKSLDFCLEQHFHFTPFVVSPEEMSGSESTTLVRSLAIKLSKN